MSNLVDIKEVILDFESNHKVHSWSYEGMELWPVLRSLVFVECRNEITSAENGVQLDWKKNKEKKRLRSLLRSLKAYLREDKPSRQSIPIAPQIQARKKDVLFFGSWYFRTYFEGKFVNKFFHPIISILSEEFKLQTLEVEYGAHPKFQEEYQQLQGRLDFVGNYPKESENSERVDSLMNSEMFQSFFILLEGKGVSEKLKFQIAQKIEKVYADSFVYQSIFQKYRPKYAFCLTFFNEAMFAMIFAASREGIKTIDLGHGFPSDKENMIYNKYTNVPAKGYNTLPDTYWVWGESVKIAMEQWTNKQDKHQVLVGGNPWLEFSQSRLPKKRLSDKKVILYTLTVNFPEGFVLDAMKKTADQFEWWIRLHPSIRGSQKELEEIFLKKSITNFNLSEANELDLSFILKNVDVHISRNSSSIYESVLFGNKPVILDQEGMDYYDFYLKNGKVQGLKERSPEKLIQLMEIVQKEKSTSENIKLTYKSALNFLFEGQKIRKSCFIV